MKAAPRSPAELLSPGRPLTLANVAEGAEGLVVSDLARAIKAKAGRQVSAVSLAVVAGTARGCSSWRAGLSFSRLIFRSCSFPRGIASPMTESRRMEAYLPSA